MAIAPLGLSTISYNNSERIDLAMFGTIRSLAKRHWRLWERCLKVRGATLRNADPKVDDIFGARYCVESYCTAALSEVTWSVRQPCDDSCARDRGERRRRAGL